eukprot:6206502-Pleurochrysis_carterae.AAC.4
MFGVRKRMLSVSCADGRRAALTFTIPSSEPEKSRGSRACAKSERIHETCPSRVASHAPPSSVHTLIVLSYEPVKTRLPCTAIARMPE